MNRTEPEKFQGSTYAWGFSLYSVSGAVERALKGNIGNGTYISDEASRRDWDYDDGIATGDEKFIIRVIIEPAS